MAAKINNITELFHRFHNCEIQLKQGKIAACLISFREIIERLPAIPKTDREKGELNAGIEQFLRNLSDHKKFQEIFGVIHLGDADLETNLEFIKSMIIAQEEVIIERLKNEEAALEAQRLEIEQEQQKQYDIIQEKIRQAIAYIDEDNLPAALEIVSESEEIREAVALHFNDIGMQCRLGRSYDDAIKNYQHAIAVSPDDENLFYNMGRAYLEAGHPDKAEDCLANAMKLNPNFKEGEALLDYLMKLQQARRANTAATSPESEKKPSGFFKKILKK